MELDATRYPNLTDLFLVEWRAVEADRGAQHFKVTVYERLTGGEPPRFFAVYDEKIQAEIDQKERRLWASADIPSEAGDSVEECMHAALTRLNEG